VIPIIVLLDSSQIIKTTECIAIEYIISSPRYLHNHPQQLSKLTRIKNTSKPNEITMKINNVLSVAQSYNISITFKQISCHYNIQSNERADNLVKLPHNFPNATSFFYFRVNSILVFKAHCIYSQWKYYLSYYNIHKIILRLNFWSFI